MMTKFMPLMAFLPKFLTINLTEIIFRNFQRKIIDQFPKILVYDVILAPKYAKMARFLTLSPRITYFDEIYVHKPGWNNFQKHLVKKLLHKFIQILTYEVILVPKLCQNNPIQTIVYFQIFTKFIYLPKFSKLDSNFIDLGNQFT